MKIPFTNIKVTPKEQIGTGLAAAGFWTGLSAVFSTAPVWASLVIIPGTVALGVGAVKAVEFAGRKIMEKLEDYAENNPGGKVEKLVDYVQSFGPDEQDEHEMDLSEGEEHTAEDQNGMFADFSLTKAASFTQRTLTNLFEREVEYGLKPYNQAEIDGMEYGSSRSGFVRTRPE